MDYAKAKEIINEIAPDLEVGPEVGGLHLNVFKRREGSVSPPFSIYLPESTNAVPMTEDQQREALVASIEIAKRQL